MHHLPSPGATLQGYPSRISKQQQPKKRMTVGDMIPLGLRRGGVGGQQSKRLKVRWIATALAAENRVPFPKPADKDAA